MSQITLPQLVRTRRKSLIHDIDKLKKIHLKRQSDWSKLENRIKDRHSSIKMNQDTSFIKDMWAFRDYGQELTRSIQDTVGFKLRRKHTITKLLLQRHENKFNKPYSFHTPKPRINLGSIQ
jgi:hypothetical protein